MAAVLAAALAVSSPLAGMADQLVAFEPPDNFKPWSLETFCGGHKAQLAFARDRARKKHVLCARQSGKSQGDDAILLDRAQLTPNSLHFLFGLNGVAVRANNWIPIWTRTLDRFRIDRRDNQQLMLTTFPNGARVYFTGTDDLRHVRNLLGNRLPAGSTLIVDESQDQPEAILDWLWDVAIPPMLTPDTMVISSGVRPDLPVGRFYRERSDPSWSHHSWSKLDNVHTPEAADMLAMYLADHGLTMADLESDLANPPPHVKAKLGIVFQVLRDWLNRDVYDLNAGTYYYNATGNGYTPALPPWAGSFVAPPGFGEVRFAQPWPGIDTFSVAIDPGGSDPFGLQVIGWGKTHRRIQHLVDWVAPRDARLTWGDVMGVLGRVVQQHYPTVNWCYDTTSDTELDTFGHQYGVPVIRAAKKADRDGQIRRTNDLLKPGTLAVMDGGNLAHDLSVAKLGPDGKWAGHHPTASECCRYALRAYWEKHQEPATPARAKDPIDREQERLAKLAQRRRR